MNGRWLILVMATVLVACGTDLPPGMKTFQQDGLSLYYPDSWLVNEANEYSVFLATEQGDTQSLLWGDDLHSGHAAILIILSQANDLWKQGLSPADMRRQMVTTSGWAARSGYSFGDPTDQTLGGHPVMTAPLTRRYPVENEPETFILNDGLVLGIDLGDGVTALMTCQAVTGEFEQFRAACIQVAESLHYKPA